MVPQNKKMKRLVFIFSLFFAIPTSAAEITSKITDSVQLKVDAAASQAIRVGGQYSVSGTNIQSSTFGGVAGAGTYSINTAGQAFTFSETLIDADTAPNSVSTGAIAPYGNITSTAAGSAGSLAGTLSNTSVPTVTAGGAGTTATGQRSIELSVFK
jgi:hypothetical protein